MMIRTVVALAALIGAASIAHAQTTIAPAEPKGSSMNRQADQNDPARPFNQLEMDKITAALTSHGYTAPSNIRRDGDSFLVTAMKNSAPAEVRVDPQSGVVKTVEK